MFRKPAKTVYTFSQVRVYTSNLKPKPLQSQIFGGPGFRRRRSPRRDDRLGISLEETLFYARANRSANAYRSDSGSA